MNKETREKISKSTTGKKNHFFGKHHTEEAKEKMKVTKGLKLEVCEICGYRSYRFMKVHKFLEHKDK